LRRENICSLLLLFLPFEILYYSRTISWQSTETTFCTHSKSPNNPKSRHKMANENGKYILYHYNPSTVAAVVFVALFSVSTFGHLIQLATRKTWYFIPFVIGGGCKSRLGPRCYHTVLRAVSTCASLTRSPNSRDCWVRWSAMV
jgi:hypothetical protein